MTLINDFKQAFFFIFPIIAFMINLIPILTLIQLHWKTYDNKIVVLHTLDLHHPHHPHPNLSVFSFVMDSPANP